MKTKSISITKATRPHLKRIQRSVVASAVFVSLFGTTVPSQARHSAGNIEILMLRSPTPVIVSQAISLALYSSLLASGVIVGNE